MSVQEEKIRMRQQVARLKMNYSPEELDNLSACVWQRLEATETFRQASRIALYHALPDEVRTAEWIAKWYRRKEILLPVVMENDLKLFRYEGPDRVCTGLYGITEPDRNCLEVLPEKAECLLVPGVAFDRQHNRLGRGKGYYDRLLQRVGAQKIGLCFHFQVFDRVPVDAPDQKMDGVVTDREKF